MKLSIETNELTRTLKALSFATSKDRMRAHLASVWIVAHPTHSHAFATDGHWLAVKRLPGADVAEEGRVAIERDDIAHVLSLAPKEKSLTGKCPVTITRAERKAMLDFNGEIGITVPCLDPGVQPAAIYGLVPHVKSTGKHERRSLNLDVFEPALKALRALAPGRRAQPDARLYPMGPDALSPVLLWSSKVPDFFAYMMPMRSHGKRDMHWWKSIADVMTPKPPVPTAAEAAAE